MAIPTRVVQASASPQAAATAAARPACAAPKRGAIAVLMPVYNEATALADTLRDLAACAHAPIGVGASEALGAVHVFVVDDGSLPPVCLRDLPPATTLFRITLARHPLNLGQGAALETARQLAILASASVDSRLAFRAFVTMDSDGQHRPTDVARLVAAVDRGADVVFGDRFAGGSAVPQARRWLLRAARAFENALTGLRLSDAHNGLRAFSPRALGALTIRQNRMAHATEIRQQVSRAARCSPLCVVEIPVSIAYTNHSLRKGQEAWGAVAILKDLFARFLFEAPS